MSLYDVAYVTWPVLLALLVAVPSVLLFDNRRAWKDGYDTRDAELAEVDTTEAEFDRTWDEAEPVDLAERIEPYTVGSGKTTVLACTCGVITGGTTDPQPDCPFHGQRRTTYIVDPPGSHY